MAIHLLSGNWSGVYVSGVTPAKFAHTKMLLSLRWFTEFSTIETTGKSVDFDISGSCNEGDMRSLLGGFFAIKQGPKIMDSATVEIPACKPNEKYSLKIARDGERDGLPVLISLVEAEVDMR